MITPRGLGLALAALALLGCRGTGSNAPRPQPDRGHSETAAPGSSAPLESTTSLPRAASPGPSPIDLLSPPPADATPCEVGCGTLHDCLLLTGESPRAAASIELGCLGNCVAQAPPRDPAFGCPRPEPLEPSSCEPFRSCIADAWVDVDKLEPANPFDDPALGAGCERVCLVYARCRGVDQQASTDDREAVDKCIQRCQLLLEPSSIKMAEDCTRLGDCDAIQTCLEDLPRAR